MHISRSKSQVLCYKKGQPSTTTLLWSNSKGGGSPGEGGKFSHMGPISQRKQKIT